VITLYFKNVLDLPLKQTHNSFIFLLKFLILMKESTLFKLALICSLVGVLILFFVSDNVDVREKAISKIEMENVGEDIKLKGYISKITDLEKVMFVEITQPEKIDVVLFKKGNISLYEGSYVEILGEIDEYGGKMQVIGNRVRVIE